MANKKYDKEEGVWRTIGGRRVFIKTGVSLSQAMKDSGKFKRKGVTSEEYQRAENREHQLREEYNKLAREKGRRSDEAIQKEEELYDVRQKYESLMEKNPYVERKYGVNKQELSNLKGINKQDDYEYKLYKRAKENPDSIDPMTENSTDWEALDSKYKDRYEKEARTTKQVNDEYNALSKKMQQDDYYYKVEDDRKLKELRAEYDTLVARGQEDVNLTEYNKREKSDWREQVKKNNELMEKELKDYTDKYDPFGRNVYKEDIKDNYYEIFRNNERRNAKIKQEVPTEPYEYVQAYAGYRDKSYKLAGTKMSGKDVVEYGTKSWTGKEYTNDEFMEHLEDSNWHSERKALLEAGLTNQELAYIKDRTTLSQWSVGEELTGAKNVEKMIKEAKNHFASGSNNLMNRYSGTVDYLQKTTNMSGAEILELLKKIENDKR